MVSKIRIMSDLKDIEQNPPSHISAGIINENDIYLWEATIMGPSNSPYVGGVFKLSILFPKNYPFSAPKIKFLTKIYHPNIDTHGNICLDILNTHWSPAMSISNVLLSITSLLDDPNADDPLNKVAADLYLSNKEEYKKKARLMTLQYASI
jgi:ubiquitin-conjugating enzyme E2 D